MSIYNMLEKIASDPFSPNIEIINKIELKNKTFGDKEIKTELMSEFTVDWRLACETHVAPIL